MTPNKIVAEVVEKYKLVADAKKYKASKEKTEKTKEGLAEELINKNLVDEKELYQKIGKHLKVPFIELNGLDIRHDILTLIPNPLANTHNVVAYDKTTSEVKLAMLDPTDIETAEFIRRKTGLEPKISITTPTDIKDALKNYRAGLEEELKIIEEKTAAEGEEGAGDLKKKAEELPVINIVSSILEHAVFDGASDIHIEPTEKEVHIRYRVDGMLKEAMSLPKNLQNGIIARIKVLANLKLDEHMVPQDGRFKIQIQDEKTAFRVSIIPVYDGEKIVMRLLPEGAKPLTLEELGFLPMVKEKIEVAIKRPHGMILVTGPTGSGKTTTLYSILGMLNQPQVNISTIEDPVEYHIGGINQSQINPKVGFTFATGLRAFLRQDPDIIMVGEIRDQETAEIAVHAAMTGHLVLSTLHTNNAPATMSRLIDMGVPPFLVAYTTNIVLAQRLVRRVCEHCKKEFHLDKNAIKELGLVFDTDQILPLLKKYSELKSSETDLDKIVFYQGEGCAKCKQSGYKGRVGIYEVMPIDEEISKKINARATTAEIKEYARTQGMLLMSEDGIIKAKQGITTISEIIRVTKD